MLYVLNQIKYKFKYVQKTYNAQLQVLILKFYIDSNDLNNLYGNFKCKFV